MQELTYAEHRDRPASPALSERLDTLNKAAGILAETIERLTGTLSPVLLPATRGEAPGLVQGGEVSPLAERLELLHRRLDALHSELVALAERVDL